MLAAGTKDATVTVPLNEGLPAGKYQLTVSTTLSSFASQVFDIIVVGSKIRVTSTGIGAGSFSTNEFIQQSDAVYHGAVPSGVGGNAVRVRVGVETSDASLGNTKLASETLTAAVLTEVVYHDDSFVRVSIQGRDGLFNAPSRWRSVKVTVTPSAAVSSLQPGAVSASCRSTAKGQGNTGVCVVSVSLPQAWFGGTVADAARAVSVAYGFDDAGAGSFAGLGTLMLHAAPGSVSGENIVAYLPSRPVYPGKMFSVDVYSTFDHLLETFTVDFGVDESMVIKTFALAPAGRWSGTAANTGSIATLSYLRDGSGLSKAGGQDRELLATMWVQVRGTAAPLQGRVSVSWNGTSNVLDETVMPADTSVIVGRDSSSRTGSGAVSIEADAVRGVFGYAKQAALVNTAVLDGKPVSSSIAVVGVRASGAIVDLNPSELVCTTSDSQVLVASCSQADVTKAQSAGSREVRVGIQHLASSVSTFIPFSVWVPDLPIRVELEDSRLQAVRGWYSEGDCSVLYQHSRLLASATFRTDADAGRDGATALQTIVFDADVSSIVAGQYTASHTAKGGADKVVAKILDGRSVAGKFPGTSVITVAGGDGSMIGSVAVEVDDTPIGVAFLDAHVVHGFSASLEPTVGGQTVDPFGSMRVGVSMDTSPLVYENDAAQVVVDVVFEDLHRMPLTTDDGLTVSSTSERNVIVDAGTFVVVPFMGSSGAGDFVKAEWLLPGTAHCDAAVLGSRGLLGTGYAFVNVSLPRAKSARVRIVGTASDHAPALFVATGGAASAAGLASSAKIIVELVYADRVIDATSDPRTHFNLSDVAGMLEIDQARKMIRSVDGARNGNGVVRVWFDHESVAAEVSVETAAMASLVTTATPYPEYPGSAAVAATTLSAIGGSLPIMYERARLHLTMELSNGHAFELPSRSASFSISISGDGSGAARIAGDVMTPSGGGVALVSGSFFSSSSGQLRMDMVEAPVHVTSMDDVSVVQNGRVLGSSRALRGGIGSAQGFTRVSATFDNGRRLTNLFGTGGTVLVPGLVSFSSNADVAVSIDRATGVLTLLGNHWASVDVKAEVAGASGVVARLTAIHTNVDPVADGDVDLGRADGQPLADRSVGDVFEVPLRVNTGGMYLGTFDMYVRFDPSILSIEAPKQAVSFNRNTRQVGSGILDAVVEGGELHFSGSIDTKTLRSDQALLVQIKFKAVGAGVSPIDGTVELLGSTSVPAKDIGARESAFVAGNVYQSVSRGRVRRGSGVGVALAAAPRPLVVPVPRVGGGGGGVRRRRDVLGCQQEYGDTNADCVFDVNDVRFVTQYLAYRGINFKGGDGPTVQSILAGSRHSRDALDADHNTEVSGKDASFLNKVNLGIFVFVEGVSSATEGCATLLQAHVYSKGNGPVNAGRLGVYFDVALENSWLQAGLEGMAVSPGERVLSAKGSFGVLIAAECIAGELGKTVCRAGLDGRLEGSATAGLSVVQAVRQGGGNVEVKLMSGLEKAPFAYATPLHVQYSALGAAVTVKSSGSAGYNPMHEMLLNASACTTTSSSTSTSTSTTSVSSSTSPSTTST